MNTESYFDQTPDGTMGRRILRGTLGVGAFTSVLVGYAASPWSIFFLSSASIYLMTTAVIGEGLLDVLVRWTGARSKAATASHACNLGHAQRVARGITASAALGSVLSGPFLMDAGDIFVASVAGFFLATTATIAWCPLVGMFHYLSSRRTDLARPPEPSSVPVVSTVAGRMSEAASGLAADVEEAA